MFYLVQKRIRPGYFVSLEAHKSYIDVAEILTAIKNGNAVERKHGEFEIEDTKFQHVEFFTCSELQEYIAEGNAGIECECERCEKRRTKNEK